MNNNDKESEDVRRQLMKTGFYEMLDLQQTASDSEVRKSYKKMALKFHPDKNSSKGSKEAFSRVSEAYDTLSDPNKRSTYDRQQQSFRNAKAQKKKATQKQFQESSSFFSSQFQRRYEQEWQYEKKQRTQKNQTTYDNYARTQREERRKAQAQQPNYENKSKGDSKYGETSSTSTYAQKIKEAYQRKKNLEFASRTSNRPAYNEYACSVEKQLRLQKEKKRLESRNQKIKFASIIALVWLLFTLVSPLLKPTQIYSMHQSSDHSILHNTSLLNSPFFVNQIYLDRIVSNQVLRQNIDRKVDLIYLKTLSRVCNNVMEKQRGLMQKLERVKSKKSKKKFMADIGKLNKYSCQALYAARQVDPSYFADLFSDKRAIHDDSEEI